MNKEKSMESENIFPKLRERERMLIIRNSESSAKLDVRRPKTKRRIKDIFYNA